MDRQGDKLGGYISADREKWLIFGGGLEVGMSSKLRIGLAAGTTSTDPSKVIFDQLRTTLGQKKTKPWEFVSGWGDLIDPDKDCKIHRNKDSLTIEMPGTDHDYDPVRQRFNAPHLLSDLEGEFDLQVRIRIVSCPSAQSTVEDKPSFVSAGFLLIYPDKDYSVCARLDYAVAQLGSRLAPPRVEPGLARPQRHDAASKEKEPASYVVEKSWVGSRPRRSKKPEYDHGLPRLRYNSMWERGWPKWPLPEKAEYAHLRLNHRSGWSTVYISPDGEKWTLLNHIPSVPAGGKVGLAAYSTSTEPSKVRFDQLKLWRAKKE